MCDETHYIQCSVPEDRAIFFQDKKDMEYVLKNLKEGYKLKTLMINLVKAEYITIGKDGTH